VADHVFSNTAPTQQKLYDKYSPDEFPIVFQETEWMMWIQRGCSNQSINQSIIGLQLVMRHAPV